MLCPSYAPLRRQVNEIYFGGSAHSRRLFIGWVGPQGELAINAVAVLPYAPRSLKRFSATWAVVHSVPEPYLTNPQTNKEDD